jgi:hypothetical protein
MRDGRQSRRPLGLQCWHTAVCAHGLIRGVTAHDGVAFQIFERPEVRTLKLIAFTQSICSRIHGSYISGAYDGRMKAIAFILVTALVLPIYAFADGYGWEGGGYGGYGWGGSSFYSSSYTQTVAVYPSGPPGSYGGYGGYAGYGGGYGGCGGVCGPTQQYPMVIGTIDWGCGGCGGYDPQWIHDPWTGTWY